MPTEGTITKVEEYSRLEFAGRWVGDVGLGQCHNNAYAPEKSRLRGREGEGKTFFRRYWRLESVLNWRWS
jgi:hypothetical protein